MKRMVYVALAWSLGAMGSGAADVVSNAMSGVRYPSLATAVAAALGRDGGEASEIAGALADLTPGTGPGR